MVATGVARPAWSTPRRGPGLGAGQIVGTDRRDCTKHRSMKITGTYRFMMGVGSMGNRREGDVSVYSCDFGMDINGVSGAGDMNPATRASTHMPNASPS